MRDGLGALNILLTGRIYIDPIGSGRLALRTVAAALPVPASGGIAAAKN